MGDGRLRVRGGHDDGLGRHVMCARAEAEEAEDQSRHDALHRDTSARAGFFGCTIIRTRNVPSTPSAARTESGVTAR